MLGELDLFRLQPELFKGGLYSGPYQGSIIRLIKGDSRGGSRGEGTAYWLWHIQEEEMYWAFANIARVYNEVLKELQLRRPDICDSLRFTDSMDTILFKILGR